MNNGATPLYAASHQGHLEVVTTLLTANASVNQSDNEGFTPLYAASQKGHNEIVEVLRRAGGDAVIRSTNNSNVCLIM